MDTTPNRYMPSDAFLDKWQEIDIDLLRLFFQQSERRLEETVKTAEGLTTQAYILLSVALPILTFSLGYVVTNDITDEDVRLYVLSAFFVLVLFFFSIIEIVRCIFPYGIEVPGSETKKLFKSEFIEGIQGRHQVRNFLFSECVSYQDRINNNHTINAKRRKYVKESMILMIISPLSVVVAWLILLFVV